MELYLLCLTFKKNVTHRKMTFILLLECIGKSRGFPLPEPVGPNSKILLLSSWILSTSESRMSLPACSLSWLGEWTPLAPKGELRFDVWVMSICSSIQKEKGKHSLEMFVIHYNSLHTMYSGSRLEGMHTKKILHTNAHFIIILLLFPLSFDCSNTWTLLSV